MAHFLRAGERLWPGRAALCCTQAERSADELDYDEHELEYEHELGRARRAGAKTGALVKVSPRALAVTLFAFGASLAPVTSSALNSRARPSLRRACCAELVAPSERANGRGAAIRAAHLEASKRSGPSARAAFMHPNGAQ